MLLPRADGFDYVAGTRKIKCRAGQAAEFEDEPTGAQESEPGKLDHHEFIKGSATYSSDAARWPPNRRAPGAQPDSTRLAVRSSVPANCACEAIRSAR
ncbi:hypothetical protein [Streptomyces sp. NPDC058330]|uniref:hypothetical protein n=1 Tax=Streptomyces sp. NPDC058330 TaxID=3346449 RepID=UPI0036E1B736